MYHLHCNLRAPGHAERVLLHRLWLPEKVATKVYVYGQRVRFYDEDKISSEFLPFPSSE